MSKYTYGQIVFITLSDRIVQEVVVREIKDNEYVLSLEQGGRITLPEERIYPSYQGAEAALKKIQDKKRKTLTYMDKISLNILGL